MIYAKTYRVFEIGMTHLRTLLGAYYAKKILQENLETQVIHGFACPTNIITLGDNELIALARKEDIRQYIEQTLFETGQISFKEKIRIVVRAVKDVLYDLNEIEDITRAHYHMIALSEENLFK